MKFDEFASTFRNPERDPCHDLILPAPPQAGEVLVAGAVVSATKESCCLSVNGAVYEIAAADIIDIQILTTTEARAERAEEEKEAKPAEGSTRKRAEQPPAKDVRPTDTPRVALIKVNAAAPMWRRIPVQAALVAAVGTWVSIAPAPAAA